MIGIPKKQLSFVNLPAYYAYYGVLYKYNDNYISQMLSIINNTHWLVCHDVDL